MKVNRSWDAIFNFYFSFLSRIIFNLSRGSTALDCWLTRRKPFSFASIESIDSHSLSSSFSSAIFNFVCFDLFPLILCDGYPLMFIAFFSFPYYSFSNFLFLLLFFFKNSSCRTLIWCLIVQRLSM